MLPRIEHPLFDTILPISKQQVKFRPLLVKEEKLLLLARESSDLDTLVTSIKQIVTNTVQTPIDVDKLPIVDLQWIFIQLRIQSIGRMIRCTVTDPTDKKEYDIEVDLSELKVKPENVNYIIRLSDKLGIKMKLPTINDVYDVAMFSHSFTSLSFNLILGCIESVYDEDSEYTNFTRQELEEFIDTLNSSQTQGIVAFFENLPKLTIKYSYTTADGTVKEWEVDKFQDFFI